MGWHLQLSSMELEVEDVLQTAASRLPFMNRTAAVPVRTPMECSMAHAVRRRSFQWQLNVPHSAASGLPFMNHIAAVLVRIQMERTMAHGVRRRPCQRQLQSPGLEDGPPLFNQVVDS